MKYLLPYHEFQYYGEINYGRYILDKSYIVARIWPYTHDRWHHTGCGANSFNSIKEAMKSLDNWLISNGYILLTEEQATKLKVLI